MEALPRPKYKQIISLAKGVCLITYVGDFRGNADGYKLEKENT